MLQNALLQPTRESVTNFNLMVKIYDSGILKRLDLKSSTSTVLNGLARYYNPKTGNVYPSLETLADKLNLGIRTISRSINELISKRIILKTKKGNKNVYCFTNYFWDQLAQNDQYLTCQNKQETGQIVQKLPVKLANKHNNNEEDKKHSSLKTINKNDDDVLKKSSLEEDYLKTLIKLESWNFIGAKFIIKKFGVEKINRYIKIVESKNPDKPGAYLRHLLTLPNTDLVLAEEKPKNVDNRAIQTKEYIESLQKIEISSPLDMCKQDAFAWCQSMPDFLRKKSSMYKGVVTKWEFELD